LKSTVGNNTFCLSNMFAAKSIIIFALLALANIVAAVPPACLLAAVNKQDNPADLAKICGSDSVSVQRDIVSVCDQSDISKALQAFAKSCGEAGKQVSLIDTATLTPSGTKSGSTPATATSRPTGTGTLSGTAAGATKTAGAGYTNKANSLAVAAIAAVIGLGVAI